MLINTPRTQIIEMLNLWTYKRGGNASEFLRVIDTDDGYKVGVIDYIDLDIELITKEDGCTKEIANKIKQRILEVAK